MPKIFNTKATAVKTKSRFKVPLIIFFVILATSNLVYIYYLSQSRCPDGYLKIPFPESVLNMCIAKYEMKKDDSGNAVSRPEGLPWVRISREEAISACRANGKRYDLITNLVWNQVALGLSEYSGNWNTGMDMYGRLNSGFVSKDEEFPLEASPDDLNGNCYNTEEECNFNQWADSRRTHSFDNKEVIWDFAGNVSEFVKGEVHKDVILDYNFISNLQTKKYQFKYFGPDNVCTPEVGPEINEDYCGFGFFNTGMEVGTTKIIKIQNPEIVRGGSWKAPRRNLVGIFATTLTKPGTVAQVIGFRCTYAPMPLIRSIGDLPNLLK